MGLHGLLQGSLYLLYKKYIVIKHNYMAGWHSGNALNCYSGNVWFNFRSGYQLSALKFFVGLFSTFT
jgi:hypothetical protein